MIAEFLFTNVTLNVIFCKCYSTSVYGCSTDSVVKYSSFVWVVYYYWYRHERWYPTQQFVVSQPQTPSCAIACCMYNYDAFAACLNSIVKGYPLITVYVNLITLVCKRY